MDLENIDIEKIIEDREAFNKLVYTPIGEAIREIKNRKRNPDIEKYLLEQISNDIPKELEGEKIKAVIFRQIATPNYEIRRFLQIIDSVEDLEPLFGEYRDDIFLSINDYKKSWGKITYHTEKKEHTKVIDFVQSEGKKISEVRTKNGISLVDFHHKLFEKSPFKLDENNFLDISNWISKHGNTARNYYRPVIMWFLKDAILFENFVLKDEKEKNFTKNIFLPEFIKIYKETGYKPMIVDLLPTTIEHKDFWVCHPHHSKKDVESGIIDSQIC